jgi:ribosomal protein L37E
MALIICPECGSRISDKSKYCVHCGYPLEQILSKMSYKIIVLSIEQAKSKKICKSVLRHILEFSTEFSDNEIDNRLKSFPSEFIYGLDKDSLDYIENRLVNLGCDIEVRRNKTEPDQYINDQIYLLYSDVLYCPECHSTDITTGQRGFNLVTGFIGSNKTVNRCARCGYSWKPF